MIASFLQSLIKLIIALNAILLLVIIFDTTPTNHYQQSLSLLQKEKLTEIEIEAETNCEEEKIDPEMELQNYDFTRMFKMFNPFQIFGAYPPMEKKYLNTYPAGITNYKGLMYGLKHEEGYCNEVDLFNLNHPQNMMSHISFFTDYSENGILRRDVMNAIGSDPMRNVSRYMNAQIYNSERYTLDRSINMFFTKKVDMHIQFELGKQFSCATQLYNHIPGHGVLKRKDMLVETINEYGKKFEGKTQCFNKDKFFAPSFRLWIKDECQKFFTDINSDGYKVRQAENANQYIIKMGAAAHQGLGVFLLDAEETSKLKITYGNNGEKCGTIGQSLIAQAYINNPLLLDRHNKFDFRVYMLVASTNPLIVYYYDGLAKVNIQPYDKSNNDRSGHLTNTRFSEILFDKAKNGEKVFNMTEYELRQYQVWTFDRLQTYLLKVGKINNDRWVDEYLRPAFQKGIMHLGLMSEAGFWKQSNVFEMFGLDFMLDDDLNLWFIECNSSPQYVPTNEFKTGFLTKMLTDMMEVMFSYYRSRMTRIYNLMYKFNSEILAGYAFSIEEFQSEYQVANQNFLEDAYKISDDNGFMLVVDKNLQGVDAYKGFVTQECVIE